MKNSSEEDFLKDLRNVDWKKIVTSTDNISLIVEQWPNMFSIILEKHAPTQNRRVSEKFSPWLTKEFKLLCVNLRIGLRNLLLVLSPTF